MNDKGDWDGSGGGPGVGRKWNSQDVDDIIDNDDGADGEEEMLPSVVL